MRIMLAATAVVELVAVVAFALDGDWELAGAWLLAMLSTVGWFLAGLNAHEWRGVAEARAETDPKHVHRASCHGPIGELQCSQDEQ